MSKKGLMSSPVSAELVGTKVPDLSISMKDEDFDSEQNGDVVQNAGGAEQKTTTKGEKFIGFFERIFGGGQQGGHNLKSKKEVPEDGAGKGKKIRRVPFSERQSGIYILQQIQSDDLENKGIPKVVEEKDGEAATVIEIYFMGGELVGWWYKLFDKGIVVKTLDDILGAKNLIAYDIVGEYDVKSGSSGAQNHDDRDKDDESELQFHNIEMRRTQIDTIKWEQKIPGRENDHEEEKHKEEDESEFHVIRLLRGGELIYQHVTSENGSGEILEEKDLDAISVKKPKRASRKKHGEKITDIKFDDKDIKVTLHNDKVLDLGYPDEQCKDPMIRELKGLWSKYERGTKLQKQQQEEILKKLKNKWKSDAEEKEEKEAAKCKKNHSMKFISTFPAEYGGTGDIICDVCSNNIDWREGFNHCKECGYDSHGKCTEDIEDPERCSKNHPLEYIRRKPHDDETSSFLCAKCGQSRTYEANRAAHCFVCSYNVCTYCFAMENKHIMWYDVGMFFDAWDTENKEHKDGDENEDREKNNDSLKTMAIRNKKKSSEVELQRYFGNLYNGRRKIGLQSVGEGDSDSDVDDAEEEQKNIENEQKETNEWKNKFKYYYKSRRKRMFTKLLPLQDEVGKGKLAHHVFDWIYNYWENLGKELKSNEIKEVEKKLRERLGDRTRLGGIKEREELLRDLLSWDDSEIELRDRGRLARQFRNLVYGGIENRRALDALDYIVVSGTIVVNRIGQHDFYVECWDDGLVVLKRPLKHTRNKKSFRYCEVEIVECDEGLDVSVGVTASVDKDWIEEAASQYSSVGSFECERGISREFGPVFGEKDVISVALFKRDVGSKSGTEQNVGHKNSAHEESANKKNGKKYSEYELAGRESHVESGVKESGENDGERPRWLFFASNGGATKKVEYDMQSKFLVLGVSKGTSVRVRYDHNDWMFLDKIKTVPDDVVKLIPGLSTRLVSNFAHNPSGLVVAHWRNSNNDLTFIETQLDSDKSGKLSNGEIQKGLFHIITQALSGSEKPTAHHDRLARDAIKAIEYVTIEDGGCLLDTADPEKFGEILQVAMYAVKKMQDHAASRDRKEEAEKKKNDDQKRKNPRSMLETLNISRLGSRLIGDADDDESGAPKKQKIPPLTDEKVLKVLDEWKGEAEINLLEKFKQTIGFLLSFLLYLIVFPLKFIGFVASKKRMTNGKILLLLPLLVVTYYGSIYSTIAWGLNREAFQPNAISFYEAWCPFLLNLVMAVMLSVQVFEDKLFPDTEDWSSQAQARMRAFTVTSFNSGALTTLSVAKFTQNYSTKMDPKLRYHRKRPYNVLIFLVSLIHGFLPMAYRGIDVRPYTFKELQGIQNGDFSGLEGVFTNDEPLPEIPAFGASSVEKSVAAFYILTSVPALMIVLLILANTISAFAQQLTALQHLVWYTNPREARTNCQRLFGVGDDMITKPSKDENHIPPGYIQLDQGTNVEAWMAARSKFMSSAAVLKQQAVVAPAIMWIVGFSIVLVVRLGILKKEILVFDAIITFDLLLLTAVVTALVMVVSESNEVLFGGHVNLIKQTIDQLSFVQLRDKGHRNFAARLAEGEEEGESDAMKTDINHIKQEVNTIKQDVNGVQSKIEKLQEQANADRHLQIQRSKLEAALSQINNFDEHLKFLFITVDRGMLAGLLSTAASAAITITLAATGLIEQEE